MSTEKISRHTSEELRRKKSKTDWERIRNMADEEIEDALFNDPVWQEMGGDNWMENAEVITPKKKGIYAKFDDEVIRYYQSFGRGYQARMNAVLRAYMEAHPLKHQGHGKK